MKTLLISIAGFFLFACTGPADEGAHKQAARVAANSGKPNILLVLVDDMGFSDIGPYGSEVSTPNLDRLADEGMRFNNFHNTAKCFPTRAALMTGQYAQRVGMSAVPGAVFRNHVTLGDVLRTAGYTTLMVGKHHALDNPYDMGFDHYWGMRDGAANHFNPGYQRDGEPYPAQKRQNKRVFCFDARCVQPYTPGKGYYTTDTFTDWAIELLGRHENEADEQPFFLYLSYTAPHDPIQAWPQDIAKYEGRYDAGYEAVASMRYQRQLELGIIDADTHRRSAPMHRDWDALSVEEKADEARVMAVYSAMIDNIDQNLGRLFAYLDETAELENTLIMFLSDNGASAEVVEIGDGEIGAIDRWASVGGHWANVSNVPFKAYKNASFEGGTNTPFIVSWPGKVPPGGAVNRTPAHLVDIMATLVDISGASYPDMSPRGETVAQMDGISLLPAFTSGSVQRGKPIFFEWRNGRAVIDGHWKLVEHRLRPQDRESGLWDFSSGEWELYDLSTDATETNNLADAHPDRFAELKARYESWWAEVEPGIFHGDE